MNISQFDRVNLVVSFTNIYILIAYFLFIFLIPSFNLGGLVAFDKALNGTFKILADLQKLILDLSPEKDNFKDILSFIDFVCGTVDATISANHLLDSSLLDKLRVVEGKISHFCESIRKIVQGTSSVVVSKRKNDDLSGNFACSKRLKTDSFVFSSLLRKNDVGCCFPCKDLAFQFFSVGNSFVEAPKFSSNLDRKILLPVSRRKKLNCITFSPVKEVNVMSTFREGSIETSKPSEITENSLRLTPRSWRCFVPGFSNDDRTSSCDKGNMLVDSSYEGQQSEVVGDENNEGEDNSFSEGVGSDKVHLLELEAKEFDSTSGEIEICYSENTSLSEQKKIHGQEGNSRENPIVIDDSFSVGYCKHISKIKRILKKRSNKLKVEEIKFLEGVISSDHYEEEKINNVRRSKRTTALETRCKIARAIIKYKKEDYLSDREYKESLKKKVAEKFAISLKR